MKAKKAAKARTKSPGANIAGAIDAAVSAAKANHSAGARAVAGFFAFVNSIEPETVEVIGDAVREKDTHRALGWLTEATITEAARHGFGG
jgi:hypothetical protein